MKTKPEAGNWKPAADFHPPARRRFLMLPAPFFISGK
jgi:hypothetical protein